MNIIGLVFGHDASACVLKDGKLVSAIAKERVTRKKHDAFITKNEVDYVLDAAGLTYDDIDHVAFTSYIHSGQSDIKIFDKSGQPINDHLCDIPVPEMYRPSIIQIGEHRFSGAFVHHHMAHAASAFFTSPFETAACFTVDSSSQVPEVCSVFAYGHKNHLQILRCPGVMIGNAYYVFTEKLGIGSGIDKAGSTMGLAPYGRIKPIAYEKWEEYGENFFERKSQPWDPWFIENMWSEISGMMPHEQIPPEESSSQKAMDIAASLQFIFERNLVKYSRELFETTKHYNGGNLCLSGGSFLNCNANMKIREETNFENIHLFPACGDDGTSVGAALYFYHTLMQRPRHEYTPKEYMYLGKEHTNTLPGGKPYDPKVVAQAISEGALVAWYQGKSEFGPRALGNRSLLGDARNPRMREIINEKIKCREWYRPFAPVVLKERASEFFDIDFESPLMLFIGGVKQPDVIPAVTHVDNSARVQTVCRSDNPAYYGLVEAFGEITGVPVLLNTSLNVNGEPIVETVENALNFFVKTRVDYLVVGDRMYDASDRQSLCDQANAA